MHVETIKNLLALAFVFAGPATIGFLAWLLFGRNVNEDVRSRL